MYEFVITNKSEKMQTQSEYDCDNGLGCVTVQRKLSGLGFWESNQTDAVQGLSGYGNYIQRKVDDRSKKRTNNTGMPDYLKNGIENMSGYTMDDIRVHYNSEKPAQFQSLAYAQGTDIYIARGQEKHLAHEAWHVVQQKQGRVSSTMQIGGIGVNDNQALEHEADVMGARAARNIGVSSVQAKRVTNVCVQRTNFDLLCEAKITYTPNDGSFQTQTVKDTGRNCPKKGRISEVLGTFERFGLINLYNVRKADNGNPPGQCAEPNAVANALGKIGNPASVRRINNIWVGDSVFEKQVEDKGVIHPAGSVYPRCDTCKQWVPGNYVDFPFLRIGDNDGDGAAQEMAQLNSQLSLESAGEITDLYQGVFDETKGENAEADNGEFEQKIEFMGNAVIVDTLIAADIKEKQKTELEGKLKGKFSRAYEALKKVGLLTEISIGLKKAMAVKILHSEGFMVEDRELEKSRKFSPEGINMLGGLRDYLMR